MVASLEGLVTCMSHDTYYVAYSEHFPLFIYFMFPHLLLLAMELDLTIHDGPTRSRPPRSICIEENLTHDFEICSLKISLKLFPAKGTGDFHERPLHKLVHLPFGLLRQV